MNSMQDMEMAFSRYDQNIDSHESVYEQVEEPIEDWELADLDY
jgi:hypothetical protein